MKDGRLLAEKYRRFLANFGPLTTKDFIDMWKKEKCLLTVENYIPMCILYATKKIKHTTIDITRLRRGMK